MIMIQNKTEGRLFSENFILKSAEKDVFILVNFFNYLGYGSYSFCHVDTIQFNICENIHNTLLATDLAFKSANTFAVIIGSLKDILWILITIEFYGSVN